MSARRPYRVRLAGDQRTHSYATRQRAIDAALSDCLEHAWDPRHRVVIHHPSYGGAPLATALVRPTVDADGATWVTVTQLRNQPATDIQLAAG